MENVNKAPEALSDGALRMRKSRKENPLHMRLVWRRAYWKKKGITTYEGIALGGMETPIEVRREVEELRKNLHDWNFQYYVWNAGPPDAQWEVAYARLLALEKAYPSIADPNSPTRRVGTPLAFGEAIRHSAPMLSLEKAKTPEEVIEFFGQDAEGVLEPKIDGCSLALHYVNGRLVKALTRGDGEEGNDVTHTARTIRTLPLMLRKKLTLEVRGEVFMRWSHFEKMNKDLVAEHDQPMANPRNAATGGLSLKSPVDAAKVPMSFIAYQVLGDLEDEKLEQYTEALELLEELGFMTPSTLPAPVGECASMYQSGLRLNDAKEVTSWIASLGKARCLQDFPTDGLVFKVDSLALQRELGASSTAPKWAVAFKYPPDQVKTRVKRIEWTVGKTGKITPVAEFEPVLVSGSTVARASLCNEAEIMRLGVNVGDDILIEKSNEIIPKVMAVVGHRSASSAQAPKQCPVCGEAIARFDGYVDVFCVNPKCKAQLEARLIYAVGKNGLNIDGCGPQAIATFVQHGVGALPGLLRSDCACFKGATKTKLLAELNKAMTAPFWRKLSALCIDGWGKTTCQEVASRWPGLEELLGAADEKKLGAIVGNVKAQEWCVYMRAHNAEFVDLLEMDYFPLEAEKLNGALNGKSFCITGSIPGCPDRGIAEDEIRKRGGVAKGGVSSKLDFLVIGIKPGPKKLAGARRWATPCISPEQLFDMMQWRPTFAALDPEKER